MHFHISNMMILGAYRIAEALLLFVLLVRLRAASFPIFTACIAIEVGIDVALLGVFHFRPHIYPSTYFTLNILDQAVQLLVVYEICLHVFCPTGVWARDVRKTLIGIAGGGMALAFLLALLAHPSGNLPIFVLIQRINLFYSVLMIELFGGMLILSSTVGLPWKTHAARIAQGYGASSLVYLVSHVVTSTMDINRHRQLFEARGRICVTLFLASEVYWIVMLWRDAPAPQELPERLRIQIYSLHQQVEDDLVRIRSWRSN